MCYIRHSACNMDMRQKELSASDWLEISKQAVDNGMVFLLLTGGEVFLRPDFFDIYEPLTRMGLILTLFTNGSLITETVAKRLSQSPPSRTEITLYGATAGTYEAVTGVPGSYAKCCAGIEYLAANRLPLGLKTTLTRQNISELEAMKQMARNWGLPFSASWLLSKRADGADSEVCDCRLPAVDAVALEASDSASAHGWTETASKESSAGNTGIFFCSAGKASFIINPAGEMNVCADLPLPAARPLNTGFPSAWQKVQRYIDGAPARAYACMHCDSRGYCALCPAWSLLETNTLTEPVPYMCEIAVKRKEVYESP